jgi:altronate dehydratase small subunit
MVNKRGLLLGDEDNVGNVLEDVLQGETVQLLLRGKVVPIEAIATIPFGFKIALSDIKAGDPIIKYNETIGIASEHIKRGALVHVHNLEGVRGRGDIEKKGMKEE